MSHEREDCRRDEARNAQIDEHHADGRDAQGCTLIADGDGEGVRVDLAERRGLACGIAVGVTLEPVGLLARHAVEGEAETEENEEDAEQQEGDDGDGHAGTLSATR